MVSLTSFLMVELSNEKLENIFLLFFSVQLICEGRVFISDLTFELLINNSLISLILLVRNSNKTPYLFILMSEFK